MNSTVQPSKSDMIWLVKSGDRISGPFSALKIEQMLNSKEIVVIDEVIHPMGRWRYLRDEPFFALIVEKLRVVGQHVRDDTELGSNNTSTQPTSTTTDTEEITYETNRRENTHGGNDPSKIQDVEYVDLVDPNLLGNKPSQPAKQFGLTQSDNVQKDIKRSSFNIWIFALVFLLVAAVITFKLSTRQAPDATGQAPDFTRSYAQAMKAYRLGAFGESLRYFKEASAIRPGDVDTNLNMAPLLLSIDGQSVEVKRRLQEVLALTHAEDQTKQATANLGLVALGNEDFAEAKTLFEDALKIDRKYVPAIFNLGVVAFAQKDLKTAAEQFTAVLREDSFQAAAHFLFAKSLLWQGLSTKNTQVYELAHTMLSTFVGQSFDYRQEALILDAYIYLKEDNRDRTIEQVRNAVETDPFATDEHWHDPLLSVGQLSWVYLYPYCEQISKKYPKETVVKALTAICLVKSKQDQEAPKVIEEALVQSPDDSLLLSVKAFINMSSGQKEEAKGSLTLAQNKSPNQLSYVLHGRLCEQVQDGACVEDQYGHLVDVTPTPIVALAGLADQARRKGDTHKMQGLLDRIRKESPNYIPYMRLESGLADR